MTCPRCKAETGADARFCEECGARLETACPGCGAPVTPGKKFCRSCGAPLTTEPGPLAAPASYTPKHLAERILTSKAALEGERKQVTVLFADLKGSMELLADRDPEEARRLLDPVLERMMEAVHRYEGTVNQGMGDGIMALFGAPLAHEDHAVRACYAALRMQEALKRYADDTRRSHGVELQIRVGLNSGEVVVRSVGTDLRMDYTAVGQTTHLAARMEQLAPPGTVRLTGETVRRAEGYVDVRALGPVPVKGLPNPIEIFELTGVGTARTRLQVSALRGLTRFVGRDTEIEHLRRVLGQAEVGRGQLVAIVGEAGVGKSRLTYEFTHSHRVQEWLVLEASSVSYAKASSYLPVIDLLKGYFKIGQRDDHREMRDKVLGRVLGLDRALEPLLSPLLALLDVPVDDAAWQNLDPPQRRQRTLDAVRRLLLRESRVQPLLVVFEDLHWIDEESQALLDSLAESLASARLLLLVNYRPEYEHRWGGKTMYSQLRLDRLPAESAAEMLAALLGPDPRLAPLTQMLVKRGNPFFLEETVQTLVETGALEGQRGAYRLTRPVESLQVPATVQAILAARIDRLSGEDKRLLQAASVVGKDVPFALLQAIADPPDETLRQGLARLQSAELLYEARLIPDLEYTFKHVLTHEVAYGGVLAERRRALHARLVDTMERLHENRLDEHVEALAHHAFLGEEWDRAVRHLRHAAARACKQSASREAVAHLERALTALRHRPDDVAAATEHIDVRLELRNALLPLGDNQAIFAHLTAAEQLAGAIGDDRRLGWVLAYLTVSFTAAGDQDEAIAHGRRALALGTATGDGALGVMGRFFLGFASLCGGNLADAVEFLQQVVVTLAGERAGERFGEPGPPAQFAHAFLGWSLAELARFDEAVNVGEESLRMAQAINQPFTLMHGYFGAGIPYLARGDVARAIPLLERGFALCRATGVRLWLGEIAADLGLAYALAGRVDDALPVLEFARQEAASAGLRFTYSRQHAQIGAAYLLAGRLDEAAAHAATALEAACAQKQRGQEVGALCLSAEIAARGPEKERAEAEYERARSLASEIGMRPLVAHCHLGLGRLYRHVGRRPEAQSHFRTATAMYREMDMQRWLREVEGAE
ncbi:MAG TPA: adenylate/guanylate cyclase domain-containing protein [Methylomirabilota bacterium]|nr:adenylate/guanylate cyclase domain-containing protein [Methylomirabilota bacterium]